MHSLNPTNQRLNDLFSRFGLNEADAPPTPTPHEFTIGTRNPALADLKRRRGRLNNRQATLTDHLDKFYENLEFPQTNAELGFPSSSSDAPTKRVALQRRASFMLNTDAMDSLLFAAREIEAQPNFPVNSELRLEVNAVLNSAKAHTEHVMAAALQDAREGDRICPLVLEPVRFPIFLEVNRAHVQDILNACSLQQPARDRALKPALESFARSYFAYSCNYEGAPAVKPQEVEITLNSSRNNEISSDRRGNITAKLAIDSADAEQFCRWLRVNANPTEDGRAMLHTHLVKGFENLPMHKKLAGFYTQLLFKELAQVQEVIGVQNVDASQHGYAAQQIAARTQEEWNYMGSPNLGGLVYPHGDSISQREYTTLPVARLRVLDKKCIEETGTPLITMPEIRSWVNSTAMPIDLRALREPMARLLLQAPPLTGRALLDLPEFSD